MFKKYEWYYGGSKEQFFEELEEHTTKNPYMLAKGCPPEFVDLVPRCCS